MAKNLGPKIKELVLEFLANNRHLNNKKCSEALKADGIQISERTVYDYRIAHDLTYDKPKTHLQIIQALEDEGHNITATLLQQKMGISRRYAYNLALDWQNKSSTKKTPQAKLGKNQRLTPHGVLTVKGAVTRHKLR